MRQNRKWKFDTVHLKIRLDNRNGFRIYKIKDKLEIY